MPDTGAPWNIPYVAGTDLVSDWPTDSQTLAEAIADGLDDASLIKQVVQTVKTDTFTTTSKTFGDITGLTASITPATATNKVLIVASLELGQTATANWGYHVRLAGGNAGNYVGTGTLGNRIASAHSFLNDTAVVDNELTNVTLVYLDSPATTSPTTYSVQVAGGGSGTGTITLNRSSSDFDLALAGRTASSLTLIEVAA